MRESDRVVKPAIRRGIRAAVPLAFAAVPFGLVYGVAVIESVVPSGAGIAGSWLVLAGAAQLSIVSLLDGGSSWALAVGTALVINARFVLYSAALAPAFSEFPARWRFGLAYLMTDQAASLGINEFERERDPEWRRWFFLGAGLFFCSGWWIGTVVGVLLGAALPASLDIGFAVPAMFIALLVPALVDRPALAAAAAGGAAAVAAAPLPSGLNVIIGAVVGIAAGAVLRRVTT